MDRVGVLAFSSGYDWVLPLANKPDQATIDAALGTLFPQGDTEISGALEEALDQLRGAPESLRHIVLFTDGWDPTDADLVPVAREIADAGVTLSVLGTGEGPGHTLERMAEIGGGRYYAGTDLAAVPDIFVEETLTVARNLINEGSFLPTVVGRSDVTESLTNPLPCSATSSPSPRARRKFCSRSVKPIHSSPPRSAGVGSAWRRGRPMPPPGGLRDGSDGMVMSTFGEESSAMCSRRGWTHHPMCGSKGLRSTSQCSTTASPTTPQLLPGSEVQMDPSQRSR